MQFRFVNVVVDLKSAKVSEMQPAPSHLVKNEISLKCHCYGFIWPENGYICSIVDGRTFFWFWTWWVVTEAAPV